ncbi:MAG TPA: hypothetical protein VMT16_16640, partial [Thermoanaerobaculia bacterium]|nr:hypothetical protein [Thermoanaerobaculia bacterium]
PMKKTCLAVLCLCLLASSAGATDLVMKRIDVDPETLAAASSLLERTTLMPEGANGVGPYEWLVMYWTSLSFTQTTTLFALTNCNDVAVGVTLYFYDIFGIFVFQHTLTIPANGVRTVNLRDWITPFGIPLEGLLRIVADQKILVEDLMVDTEQGRSSGQLSLKGFLGHYRSDVAAVLVARASRGGGVTALGTMFNFFFTAPQGPDPDEDPATFIIFIYDTEGVLVGGVAVWVNKMVVKLDFEEIAVFAGFAGIDAKLVIWGNSAFFASFFEGFLPPSVDVGIAGVVIYNSGPTFNFGDRIKVKEPAGEGVESPFE